jgi:hypothetical protein
LIFFEEVISQSMDEEYQAYSRDTEKGLIEANE